MCNTLHNDTVLSIPTTWRHNAYSINNDATTPDLLQVTHFARDHDLHLAGLKLRSRPCP